MCGIDKGGVRTVGANPRESLSNNEPRAGNAEKAPKRLIEKVFFLDKISESFKSFAGGLQSLGDKLGKQIAEYREARRLRAEYSHQLKVATKIISLDLADAREIDTTKYKATFTKSDHGRGSQTPVPGKCFVRDGDNKHTHKCAVSYATSVLMSEVTYNTSEEKLQIIANYVDRMSAETLDAIETKSLRKFAGEFEDDGREKKAEFLRAVSREIEDKKNPALADNFYLLRAKTAMSDIKYLEDLESFLSPDRRGITELNKLMSAHGLSWYRDQVRSTIEDLQSAAKNMRVSEQLLDTGVWDDTGDVTIINPELSRRVTAFTIILMEKIAEITIPSSVKEKLDELIDVLWKNNEELSPEELKDYVQKLYFDQVIGSVLSAFTHPGLAKSNIVNFAFQFIKAAAEGIEQTVKHRGEAHSAYRDVIGPELKSIFERILTGAGMPQSDDDDQAVSAVH